MLISISGSQGSGKAQPLYSKILTPSGWVMMGDIKVGDEICTPSGEIAKVSGIFPQGIKPVYTLTTHDGAQTNSCIDHLWRCCFASHTKRNGKSTYVKRDEVVDTQFIINYLNTREQHNKTWGCGISLPLITDKINSTPLNSESNIIPPYLLGTLLGDGGFTNGCISLTTIDHHILDKCEQLLEPNYKFVSYTNGVNYRLVGSGRGNSSLYVEQLKKLNLYNKLSHEKFIPTAYKQQNNYDKWELIQGLFDTDGTISKTGSTISFTSTSFTLAKDVQELIWSLGGTASVHIRNPKYKNKQGVIIPGKTAYEVIVKHNVPNRFFSLPRKLSRCKNFHYEGHKDGSIDLKRRIVDVTFKGNEEVQCIMIDHPDHLYITDDYIVTHNTTILKEMENLGYNVITRKTSRSILADWEVTLEEVNNNSDLTIKFQNEIIKRKHQDEMIAIADVNSVWFTERTYADLMTYFLISTGKDNRFTNEINDYYRQCIAFQQYYDKVFYLKAGHFVPEHDGVRGANVHYSRMADLTMLDLTRQMTSPSKLTIIDTPCLAQRTNMILAQCGLYK